MVEPILLSLKRRARAFEKDAHKILAVHEGAKSRVITLHETRVKLQGLSLVQDQLFKEALDCIEANLFRSACVMAWAGFIDGITIKLVDNINKVHEYRKDWKKYICVEDLQENITDADLLKAARYIGIISRAEIRELDGNLSTRNRCAHPGTFKPNLNVTLGYVDTLLTRSGEIRDRKAR